MHFLFLPSFQRGRMWLGGRGRSPQSPQWVCVWWLVPGGACASVARTSPWGRGRGVKLAWRRPVGCPRVYHPAGGWAPRAGSGPFDAWGAGRQLAEAPSVPTGHPVRLGEQVGPALSPATSLPPSLTPPPCPRATVWVGLCESSWSCSSASLSQSHRGETEAWSVDLQLGLGPSMSRGGLGLGLGKLQSEVPLSSLLPPLSSSPHPCLPEPVLGTGSLHPWYIRPGHHALCMSGQCPLWVCGSAVPRGCQPSGGRARELWNEICVGVEALPERCVPPCSPPTPGTTSPYIHWPELRAPGSCLVLAHLQWLIFHAPISYK